MKKHTKDPLRFTRSPLSQAISLALLTVAGAPAAMAGSGSCADGANVVGSNATVACVLNQGDSVTITGSGSITGDYYGVYVDGAEEVGDITNNGEIDASYYGIYIYGTAGDITNNGIIKADDQGIYIYGGSTIGNIVNDGTIDAYYKGIYVYGGTGVTSIESITNSGLITTDSGAGIYIHDSANAKIAGSVENSGTIDADNHGMYLYGVTIGGDILNSGVIKSDNGGGIYVQGGSNTIGGDVINSGTIDVDQRGIYVHASIGGDVVNSGVIDAGDSGIYIYGSVGGDVVNSGTITADDTGIYIYGSVDGNVENTGLITSDDDKGIYVNGDVAGDVVNSGTIESYYAGIYVYGSVGGDVKNTGLITSSDGKGIYVNGDVAGNVVNSGTIDAYGGGIYLYGDVGGDVVNSGTVISEGYGIYVYGSNLGGDIANSGLIESDYSGIYVFDGSTVQGSIVNSGIINAGGMGIYAYGNGISIIGDVINSGTIDADSYSMYVYGAIGGDVINSGRAIGALYVDGADVVNTGLVHSSGYDSYVANDYTQSRSGIYRLEAESSVAYDTFTVDGTASFAGGSGLSVDAAVGNTLADGNVLMDVVVAGTLDATTFSMTDNALALSFTPVIDGNTVDLTVAATGLTSVEDAINQAGYTPGKGVAPIIDNLMAADPSGDFAFAFGSANTPGQVARVAESVLPVLTGGAAQASLNLVDGITAAISDRQQGMSSGDGSLDFADKEVWVKVVNGSAEQDDRDGVSGYDIDSNGIAFGIDGDVSSSWRLGAALGYVQSETDNNGATQEIDTDSIVGKVYATHTMDDANKVYLQLGVGQADSDSERSVFGNTAKGSYDAMLYQASAEFAHSLNKDLEPYVRLDYKMADVDGYTEKGAGVFNLDVDSDDAESLVLAVGSRASMALSDSLELTGDAGIGYDFMTDTSSVTSAFQGGGAIFNTRGMEQDEIVYNLGVGANYSLTGGTLLSVNYDFQGREDYEDHNLSLTARYKLAGGGNLSAQYNLDGSEEYAHQDVTLKVDWQY